MKKKYLFFDIDGTLAGGGHAYTYVPDSCREALRKVREAGHFTAICTGRSQCLSVKLMKELGFHHMVSDGGYGITIDDELLEIIPLDKERVIDLIDECKEKGIPWALHTDNTPARKAPDSSFFDYTHDEHIRTEVVEGLDPRNCENIYKAYVACHTPEEYQLESLKKLPWCRVRDTHIFVEPVDKAFGIKKIMDHFHADYQDVIVFGDSLNDITMFIDEWTCVAMGNAEEEIKAKADLITTSLDEDGIYKACEKLQLFEPTNTI